MMDLSKSRKRNRSFRIGNRRKSLLFGSGNKDPQQDGAIPPTKLLNDDESETTRLMDSSIGGSMSSSSARRSCGDLDDSSLSSSRSLGRFLERRTSSHTSFRVHPADSWHDSGNCSFNDDGDDDDDDHLTLDLSVVPALQRVGTANSSSSGKEKSKEDKENQHKWVADFMQKRVTTFSNNMKVIYEAVTSLDDVPVPMSSTRKDKISDADLPKTTTNARRNRFKKNFGFIVDQCQSFEDHVTHLRQTKDDATLVNMLETTRVAKSTFL